MARRNRDQPPCSLRVQGQVRAGRVLARIQLIDAPVIHERIIQRPPRATAGLGTRAAVSATRPVYAAAAGLPPRRATAKATPTSTASGAIPARSRRAGRANVCARRCVPGAPATASSPPPRTGLAPTPTAAAAKGSSDYGMATGRRQASLPTPTGAGPRHEPPHEKTNRCHDVGHRGSAFGSISLASFRANDPRPAIRDSMTRTGLRSVSGAQSRIAASTRTACTTSQTGGTPFPPPYEPWRAADNDPLPRPHPTGLRSR